MTFLAGITESKQKEIQHLKLQQYHYRHKKRNSPNQCTPDMHGEMKQHPQTRSEVSFQCAQGSYGEVYRWALGKQMCDMTLLGKVYETICEHRPL